MTVKIHSQLKNTHLSLTFLNIDISLIFGRVCLNFSICIVQTRYEGTVSQTFNIGLHSGFCFVTFKKWIIVKQNSKK